MMKREIGFKNALARQMTQDELVVLGNILQKELDDRGLSLGEFAILCGVSKLTVFNVIHAKHEISIRTLAKINSWLTEHPLKKEGA